MQNEADIVFLDDSVFSQRNNLSNYFSSIAEELNTGNSSFPVAIPMKPQTPTNIILNNLLEDTLNDTLL